MCVFNNALVSHRGHSEASGRGDRGHHGAPRSNEGSASAAELELGSRARLSEGRAAGGEQEITQRRESVRLGQTGAHKSQGGGFTTHAVTFASQVAHCDE